MSHFIIDEADNDILNVCNWKVQPKIGYVTGSIKGKTVYLHRYIMDAQKGQEVDHINRNKLDNRRENLRFATRELQSLNQNRRGAYFDKSVGGYKAVFKKKYLGLYKTMEEAVNVYSDYKLNYIKENF